ncbi:MAG: CDP-alcohol phosphatidyltransferase family protein [Gammaproteobacteria bacterium]|nr:CDP-alcohol phosphatidyltransferase family protein [Gammaproteobacteria bacterium]
MYNDKPLDARLAAWLVYPLRDTAVTPNHLTSARLLAGIVACALLATGEPGPANAGALFLVLSNFLDHTDGELARITGKTSKFGHYYDLASDAVVDILLFAGIGFGLMHGPLGTGALFMGILAGVSVAAIFQLRLMISNITGKFQIEQPNIGLFEIEDVFYLMPLITFFGLLQPFLVIAVIVAQEFAQWTLLQYLGCKKGHSCS